MNISLSEAIAKKQKDKDVFQSLEGHTEDSLILFKDYLSKNISVLKRFSADFSIDYESLLSIIFLTVYLHDIGKLTEDFQRNIKQGKPCGNVSHPFFSFPFIHTSLKKTNKELELMLRLCILSHHSQLYNRIYEDAKLKNKTAYLLKPIEAFINNTGKMFCKIGFDRFFGLIALPVFELPEYYNSFQLTADIRDDLSALKHYHKTLVRNKESRMKAVSEK
jgi:CRISPR-associated endonuclease/helicase Cas3